MGNRKKTRLMKVSDIEFPEITASEALVMDAAGCSPVFDAWHQLEQKCMALELTAIDCVRSGDADAHAELWAEYHDAQQRKIRIAVAFFQTFGAPVEAWWDAMRPDEAAAHTRQYEPILRGWQSLGRDPFGNALPGSSEN